MVLKIVECYQTLSTLGMPSDYIDPLEQLISKITVQFVIQVLGEAFDGYYYAVVVYCLYFVFDSLQSHTYYYFLVLPFCL
jgi:hypothetical protein